MTTPSADLLSQPLRTQADLETAWRTLMGPLGFSHGSLWLLRVGPDDLALPGLVQIEDDADGPPEPEHMSGLAEMLRMVGDDGPAGCRWAVLRARPGRGGVRPDDRTLAAALMAACREHGVPTDVMHLATDDTLVPLPYDELARSE